MERCDGFKWPRLSVRAGPTGVVWWHDRGMTAVLPRTIRAVDTDQLLLLELEAARLGFSQRLPADWLREHAQAAAVQRPGGGGATAWRRVSLP
ncbi:hypothetical protein CP972_03900 [Streptomyces prasinus]|uniref:Uncharacterized protein n=2 Tax=Streptomyces prasinus TaxID=67345 RepID=A0ABX6AQY6_9ACTN|nr:hypothetical protein CP972_03900 [Streptomyces prasinus]